LADQAEEGGSGAALAALAAAEKAAEKVVASANLAAPADSLQLFAPGGSSLVGSSMTAGGKGSGGAGGSGAGAGGGGGGGGGERKKGSGGNAKKVLPAELGPEVQALFLANPAVGSEKLVDQFKDLHAARDLTKVSGLLSVVPQHARQPGKHQSHRAAALAFPSAIFEPKGTARFLHHFRASESLPRAA
jgi:hypothetical protein